MKDIINNVIGSVISAVIIALVFFVWNDFCNSKANISGIWKVENIVTETQHDNFKDMKIYYEAFINETNGHIEGSAEKTAEYSFGRRFEYERDKRVHIEINGKLKNNFLVADEIHLFLKEHGRLRDSTASMNLRAINQNHLEGQFYSTAANSKGRTIWKREK